MATTSKCNAKSLLGRQQQSFTIPPYHHPTAETAASQQQQQQQQQHSFTNNSFLSSNNNNNNNNHDYFNHSQFSGVTDHEMMMMKCRPTTEKPLMVDMEITEKNKNNQMVMMAERKRRLRSDQIDWLERSFQEDIKLEPERKMKLSQELSLHPRQVAIWFQNRRARWKTKQLERLYDSLKLEFDVICREKQNLQEEVLKLRAKLEELETVKQVSTGYTEASTADETVESTSVVNRSSNIQETTGYSQMIAGSSYISSIHNYNSASQPCWGVLPPGYP